MEKINYMVTTICMTYNQAPYIVETLDGFCSQKTAFPVVYVIMDDASTDGEPEVIRQYLKDQFGLGDKDISRHEETDDYEMCFAQHDNNNNCYFAVYFLKYNHFQIRKPKLVYCSEWTKNSKYRAICEGDDYWNNPAKLQLQVDYLENHPDCGMIYAAFEQFNQNTGERVVVRTNPAIPHDENFKWKIIEQKVMIGTCTVLLKEDLYKSIRSIKDDYKGFMMGDTQTWFNAARLASVGYIPDVMGVYRKQQTGRTASIDQNRRPDFLRGCLALDMHLANKYGAPKKTKRIIKYSFGISLLEVYLKQHDYEAAKGIVKELFHGDAILLASLYISKKRGLDKFSMMGRAYINFFLSKINK